MEEKQALLGVVDNQGKHHKGGDNGGEAGSAGSCGQPGETS